MGDLSVLIILIVIVALIFDFINGFHDTANAIATLVSTRVLSPRTAIMMAAVLNFVGALVATGVAKTVAAGLIDPKGVTQTVVLAALLGAIVWNLITWHYGIPSSSSHALFGGLCGAAGAHGGTDLILWDGLTNKVLIPIVLSPLAGFVIGLVVMKIIYAIYSDSQPGRISLMFRALQIGSGALLSFSHGSNDAQKSMGIITMALLSQNLLVAENPSSPEIPNWVIFSCAVAMALGTSMGGWRIMKTMGHKIMRLEPVHGFAAQSSASAVILLADHFQAPISTTQVITGSIFGVGVSKRFSAVKWGVARSMVVAWFLTLPTSAGVAALMYYFLRAVHIE